MFLSNKQKYLLSLKNAEKYKQLKKTRDDDNGDNFEIVLQKPISISDYANKKKILKFNCNIRVILIPMISEYKHNNIDKDLWYKSDDYDRFSSEYRDEMYKAKYNSI